MVRSCDTILETLLQRFLVRFCVTVSNRRANKSSKADKRVNGLQLL